VSGPAFCLLHGAGCDGRDDVDGQLELGEETGACALCRRPRRSWADLCDDCNDAFQDFADALADLP
jgi:predicted amidophosphoribosyltransferase